MASYRILLTLHILAVVLGLGVTFVYPFLQGFAERRGPGPTRFMLQFARRLEFIVVYPGAALVFLFGLALIFDDQTGYSDDMPTWLTVSIVWYVLAIGVSVFFQQRNISRALESLEGVADSAPMPDAYRTHGVRIQMVGGLLGLSVIGILVLMVFGRTGAF